MCVDIRLDGHALRLEQWIWINAVTVPLSGLHAYTDDDAEEDSKDDDGAKVWYCIAVLVGDDVDDTEDDGTSSDAAGVSYGDAWWTDAVVDVEVLVVSV
jgi:hypothetical protein